MTGYINFIKDFPNRCRDILHIAREPALLCGREVTLAIMVASAGFVVPYERLKFKPDHPSGDSRTFSDAAEKLKSLLDKPFTSSVLFNKMGSPWYDGRVVCVNGRPESWGGLRKREPFSKDKTVKTTINVIRNGLAHGNIFTFDNPIHEIAFVEKKNFNGVGVVSHYSFVSVGPEEFLQFLHNWFDFLNDFDIPQEVTFEVLKYAA